jgi:DNA-binding response OmpR family regulator
MSPPATTPRQGPAARRRRVLAIDDDDGLLDMLELLLGQSKMDLRTARGGEAGFAVATSWDPDLILLDLSMPDLDGAGFLERYRETAASPASVVLLTGAQDGPARATELGVTRFLAKPFDLGALVEIVDACVGE